MAKKQEMERVYKSVEDFEACYEELRQCLNKVRDKEAPLHIKIEAMERGVELHREIRQILDSAELKIEEIKLGIEQEED